MSDTLSDELKDLCDLFGETGWTFSKDCVSGLIGEKMCRCWRCRGVEPQEQEPEWKRVAELVSEGFHSEMGRQIARSRERLAKAIAAPLLSTEIEEKAKALYGEGRVVEAQAVILEGLQQEDP